VRRFKLALRVLFIAISSAAAAVATAAPFHFRYDATGGHYPEEVGWTRSLYDPDDAYVRNVENGELIIDSRGSLLASDRYTLASEMIVPGPGEWFEMTWRVQTTESSGNFGDSDVSVALLNESLGFVAFYIGPDFVAEDRYVPGGIQYIQPIAPDVAHTYRLVSPNLQNYDLYIDGVFAFDGEFHLQGLGLGPRVVWGDRLSGGVSSRSAWGFVEVLTIPEPPAAIVMACALGILSLWNRFRSNRL